MIILYHTHHTYVVDDLSIQQVKGHMMPKALVGMVWIKESTIGGYYDRMFRITSRDSTSLIEFNCVRQGSLI